MCSSDLDGRIVTDASAGVTSTVSVALNSWQLEGKCVDHILLSVLRTLIVQVCIALSSCC